MTLRKSIRRRCAAVATALYVVTPTLNATPADIATKTLEARYDTRPADLVIRDSSALATTSLQILRSYVLLGLNIRARRAKEQITQHTNKFEQLLSFIDTYAQKTNNDQLERKTKEALSLWSKIKPEYSKSPEINKSLTLYKFTTIIVELSNDIGTILQNNGGSKLGKMVDISGNQTILSQKISLLYCILAWDENPQAMEEYTALIAAFDSNLLRMQKHPINNKEVNKKLSDVHRQFKRFKFVSRHSQNTYVPALIDHSSSKMLTELQEVSNLYLGLSWEYGLSKNG